MIDKTIHYVWVGNNKPDFVNACIRNWKLTLPNYKFVEWNESNIDFDSIFLESKFIKECYERKLWAYVSDYVRLKVLYEYGGVYLDTDITLEKDITPLLNTNFFIGKEDEEFISAGIIGASKKNLIIKKIMSFYENEIYKYDFFTIPKVITHCFNKNKHFYEQADIYPPEYFYPYHYTECFNEKKLTNNTYTIHWWGKSWMGENTDYLFTKHLNGFDKIKKISRIKISKIKNKICW